MIPTSSYIISTPSTLSLLPQTHHILHYFSLEKNSSSKHNTLQMMHRCSCSHVGPCSCGLFHTQTDSFSMLFSMPNHHYNTTNYDVYSSVDCTLSLGTPSTRLTEDVDDSRRVRHDRRPSSSSSCMSNFCWDMFQNKNTTSYPTSSHNSKSNTSRGSNSSCNNSLSSNDPLLARRCANCDTTSTPLWRNGPRGPKSLCNACGIRFKKEERRAIAANANSRNGNHSGSGMDYGYQGNSTWVQSQKMACFSPAANEFRFIEDNDRDSDSGNPFFSWRLNRPGLVHDFTR